MELGERIAKVEVEVKIIKTDVKEIKSDVKSLLEFKWRIYGVTAGIAFIVTTAIDLFFKAAKQ